MSVLKIKIGVTGGIGSGKSYVCRILEEKGVPVFYSDDEARREMISNPLICSDLKALLGDRVYDPVGNLNKSVVRDYISRGKDCAEEINKIVHPRLKERLCRLLEECDSPLVVMECALLFETGYDDAVDYTVLVTAPEDLRIERVMERDHITKEQAKALIDLQMSEDEKIRQADYVIVNDEVLDLYSQLEGIPGFKFF